MGVGAVLEDRDERVAHLAAAVEGLTKRFEQLEAEHAQLLENQRMAGAAMLTSVDADSS